MKTDTQTPGSDTSTPSERFFWYDKLHFVPIEDKTPIWGAQVLAYIKLRAKPFVSEEEARKARELEEGKIDPAEYKKMIDPVTTSRLTNKDGVPYDMESGGAAEYFHADWKTCPIYIHLDNIVAAKIKQIPLNLGVKASDEYAQLKQEKENSEILGRTQFTGLINGLNKIMKYPPLKAGEDPFRYSKQLKNNADPGAPKKVPNQKNKFYQQPPTSLVDSIKASIDDPDGLALYNEFIRKDGAEIACEVGIKYYMLEVNKFLHKANAIISDIKNFNKAAVRFYTSETTGRPVIDQIPVDKVHIMKFEEDDGSDLKAWFIEYDIPFGQFIQEFGAGLNKQQLKDVFEANKKIHNVETDFDKCDINVRKNAAIRVGYVEFESQDMEVYSDYEHWGNQKYKKEDSGFKPDPKKFKNSKRDESHYNAWYKFYYIPHLFEAFVADYNIEAQAKTIYKFGHLQDQQREGDDFRYSKTSLTICQSRRMTWAQIINSFMPKINMLWFKFQNEMVNSMPNGLYFAEELVTSMAKIADSAGNDNTTASVEFMRRIKQTGWGVGKVMKNAAGDIIGDGKPFFEMNNNMLKGALEKLEGMMLLYNLMMKSLGQSDISEGEAPKPRQNLGGIQLALAATGNSQYFIEDPYMMIVLELAQKFIYYFKNIVDEGDSKRLQDFKNIVGQASGTAWEAIKDIPYHNIGLSVDNVMTDDQRKLVNELAQSLAAAGILMPEDAVFISMIDDLKYAYAILSLKAKAGRKLLAEQQAQAAQVAQQTLQLQTQLKIAEIHATGQNTLAVVNAGKQWDMKIDHMVTQLKGEFQTELKKMVNQNKTEEIITESQVNKANNTDHVQQIA